MKYISTFDEFDENKHEFTNIKTNINDIISKSDLEYVDITKLFKLDKNYVNNTLSFISKDSTFINTLSSLGLKKSNIEHSIYYQTFLDDNISWLFIYNINDNNLTEPRYIIIESDNKIKMYKNTNIKKFFDNISTKTITVNYNNKDYIYTTYDANTWELENRKENKVCKKELNNDELYELLNNKDITINESLKEKDNLILEFSEFNLQRLNQNNAVEPMFSTDNPQLSQNAYDKQSDNIRMAFAKLDDIHRNINIYDDKTLKRLRNNILLEEQKIKSITIKKILKNDISYNFYISIIIDDIEYWGEVKDILGNTEVTCECFYDKELIQSKQWIIYVKNTIINNIKKWLNPELGKYLYVSKKPLVLYSYLTQKSYLLKFNKEVHLVQKYKDKLTIKIKDDYYDLKDDNFIFFNYKFDKVQ